MILNLSLAGSTFVALSLLALWALRGVGRPGDERIRTLALARQQGEGLRSLPLQQRVVAPIIESLGRTVASVLPGAFVRRTERRLILAGRPLGLGAFYTLMAAVGLVLSGAYLLFVFAVANGTPSPLVLFLSIPIAFIGMYLVTFWLSSRASARQTAMVRGLPDSMDLLTICVEAGLGLDAAFYRVVEKQSGPLVDEIRQMLREIGLGKTRRDAILDLADRTDIEDARTFANAVIQSEQLGTSLAQVLRTQSQRLRVRRRQRAEQEARRVPVKMAFPLVFCLMPSLFIFILGPIVVNFIGYLSD